MVSPAYLFDFLCRKTGQHIEAIIYSLSLSSFFSSFLLYNPAISSFEQTVTGEETIFDRSAKIHNSPDCNKNL
jgi:hypothetical protein